MEEGDVLISRAGSVGESFLIDDLPFPNVVFASYLIRFKPIIDRKYFKYFLQSPDYWNAITENQSGIAVPNVNATKLNAIKLPLPPEETQHLIVEKIEELFSELDHGVVNLKKARQQLKTYRQAVLKDAFEGKLTKEWREQQDDLPTPEELFQQIKAERKAHRQRELAEWEREVEQWEKDGKNGKKPNKPKTHKIERTLEKMNSRLNEGNNTCLVSLEHIKSYSIYGPRYSSKEYEDVGVAVLRTSDISEGGKVDWKNAPKIPLTDYDFNKYKLEKGDLLITRTGSIGTISVFDDEVKAIPGAFLIHYRLIPDVVNPWYVYYFLRTNKAQNHFKEKSAGVGRPNLNVPSIEELLIPSPSIQEQNIVVQEIESHLSVVDQLEQTIKENLQKAEALRQSILKKAFRGELVKEEPAKILEFQKSPQIYYENKPTDLHAALMCKIIGAHYKNEKHLQKLNHVKCEKIIHMLESHEGIELEREPVKDAAGPDDYPRLKRIEHRAKFKNWFENDKSLGGKFGYGYKPKKSLEYAISDLEKIEGLPLEAIDKMIELFLKMDKERAEIVATLYAAWNNFLIDGHQPSDEEIVRAAREDWSKQKLSIERERFFKALPWMRKNGLIPSGKGKVVLDKQ